MDATRVAELKSALKQRVDQIDEGITKGVKVDGSNVEVSQETANRIRSLMGEATEIKSLLDAEVFGTEVKEWMNAPADSSVALDSVKQASKSLGEMFTESSEFKAQIGRAHV